MRGALHYGERRQTARELHRHVQLRGGLAPPMFRPVEAVERQLYRARIQEEYPVPPDPRKIAAALLRAEAGVCRLEVREKPPEHILGCFRVAFRVGVREGVPARKFKPRPVPLVRERLGDVADSVERFLP